MRLICLAICFLFTTQIAKGQEAWEHQLMMVQQYQLLMMRIQEMDKGTDAVLKLGLNHPEPTYRYAAAMALGKKKQPQQQARLIELLNDEDVYVQQMSRWALWKLSKGQDFGPLPGCTEEQVTACQTAWREWWEKKK